MCVTLSFYDYFFFNFHRYALAETLNLQLDDAARNVSGIIGQVNALTAPPSSTAATVRAGGGAEDEALAPGTGQAQAQAQAQAQGEEDAVGQIAAILNAHLGSLRWVDDTATALRDRLAALRRGHTDVAQTSWRR